MFKRKEPLHFWERVRNYIYPKMGFFRTTKYHALTIARISDKESTIAKGIAFGIAVSFTPFIGLHMGIISILCLIFRGNIIAAYISSLIGNPITFPFIWYLIYMTGILIMPSYRLEQFPTPLIFIELFGSFIKSILNLDYILFKTEVFKIWFPMLIGCIPLVIITYIVSYKISCFNIKKYQELRKSYLKNKQGKKK